MFIYAHILFMMLICAMLEQSVSIHHAAARYEERGSVHEKDLYYVITCILHFNVAAYYLWMYQDIYLSGQEFLCENEFSYFFVRFGNSFLVCINLMGFYLWICMCESVNNVLIFLILCVNLSGFMCRSSGIIPGYYSMFWLGWALGSVWAGIISHWYVRLIDRLLYVCVLIKCSVIQLVPIHITMCQHMTYRYPVIRVGLLPWVRFLLDGPLCGLILLTIVGFGQNLV